MTCEIALMNRQAVALAADSAATVRYWDANSRSRKQRHFKGANKIFNLSYSHPVGLMVYDSLSLQGVPWEVIVKSYRDHIGNKCCNTLGAYAEGLFDFIEKNDKMFPPAFARQQFFTDVLTTGLINMFVIDNKHTISEEKDPQARQTAWDSRFTIAHALFERSSFFGRASQDDVDSALEKYGAQVKAGFLESAPFKRYADLVSIDLDTFVADAIKGLFKRHISALDDNAGIVVAGYGDDDYFPSLCQYICHGMVLGRVLYSLEDTRTISQTHVSEVVPLAQSEMVRGFTFGINPSALGTIETQYAESVDEFEAKLRQDGHVGDDADLSAMKAQAKESFSDGVQSKLSDSHTTPMRRVVGLLPVDELAELAEILVRIESLKERVTRDTEEVSGPIDVAVISKGDGFIWIRRKHYFDPKLNPRYFSRKGMTANDHARTEEPPSEI